MKKTFTITLLSLMVLSVFAQDTGTLKGVVKDKASGETIIGANIVWEADKSRGAATDFDGKFSIVLPAGNQKVIITSIGYAAKTVPVSINSGASTELNVTMEMESKQVGDGSSFCRKVRAKNRRPHRFGFRYQARDGGE
jgi:hypothetical protein